MTNAAILTIFFIILIEYKVHPYLFNNFVSHEVDWTVRSLQYHLKEPVVVIGDSVGHRVFREWGAYRGKIANLACNQATETAGQYFFLKRFIEQSKLPGAIITCDRTPFIGNLEQSLTENYIQRVFTKWSEIYELLIAKLDPVFSVKMVAYKLLSTFKYRLHLQEKIVGFTNSSIYSGVTSGKSSKSSRYGIIRLISDAKLNFQQTSLSYYFFKKILFEAAKNNIPVYYLPPPTQLEKNTSHRLVKSSLSEMEVLADEFDNLHILAEFYQRYPRNLFADDVHPNSAGLEIYRPTIQPKIDSIVSDAKELQINYLVNRFERGSVVFNYSTLTSFENFTQVSDVELNIIDGQLVVTSSGNDPAIMIPEITHISKNWADQIAVKITVTSTVDTVAKLYFSTDQEKQFSENNRLKHQVQIGSNTMFFLLPNTFNKGWLRLDPGTTEGTYTINKVEGRIITPNY